jgi:hypothetical protein
MKVLIKPKVTFHLSYVSKNAFQLFFVFKIQYNLSLFSVSRSFYLDIHIQNIGQVLLRFLYVIRNDRLLYNLLLIRRIFKLRCELLCLSYIELIFDNPAKRSFRFSSVSRLIIARPCPAEICPLLIPFWMSGDNFKA